MPPKTSTRFLDLLDGTATRDEVTQLMDGLMRFLKDFRTSVEKSLAQSKGEMAVEMEKARQMCTDCIDRMDKMMAETKDVSRSDARTTMRYIDQRFGELKALIPTNGQIQDLIEPLIPSAVVVDELKIQKAAENSVRASLKDNGIGIRDGLEQLTGDARLDASAIKNLPEGGGGGRIGWGAHPLTLQQSGTTKAKVVRTINFTGATVSLGANGVVTVAVTGGSGWTVETPTGAVNGSNTAFTVTATPQYIVVDGITYFENNGYTLSGLNVTTTVPPTGFIRSIY